MSAKRSHIELDPDYEDVSEQQNKRRRVLEEGAKEATKRKIEAIIRKQFVMEIESKEAEILAISEKLEVSRNAMDRLRACIVASYYGNTSQQKSSKHNQQDQAPMIHPTVRKYIGKAPPGTPMPSCSGEVKQGPSEGNTSGNQMQELGSEKIGKLEVPISKDTQADAMTSQTDTDWSETRAGRFKIKRRVIVGNVSKSIPADQRDENDQATHKWMVYVRGPKENSRIDDFVKKVWFFLHPSYRPNDLVEVSHPPFHLTRRGWGEFPVRVQLHFKDSRNKRLDIVHNLKLDRTYTGLQTMGAETVVNVEVEKDKADIKREKRGRTDAYSTLNRKKTDNSNGCILEGSTLVEMKKEPGIIRSLDLTPCVPVSPILRDIKTEPIDHDYGVYSSVGSASTPMSFACNNLQNVKIKIEPGLTGTRERGISVAESNIIAVSSQLQTMVSVSIVTTQALSQVSPGVSPKTPVLFRVEPVTPTKQNHIKVEPVSPNFSKSAGTQPVSRNVVLRGFGSVSSPNLLDCKSPTQTMSNTIITPSMNLTRPILQTKVAGNQLLVQSGLQTPKTQPLAQNKSPGNPSTSSERLVFLKCTDNQGKIYLLPQQICTSLSPAKGSNPLNLLRVTAPNSQPVMLTSTPSQNQTSIRIPLNLSSSLLSPNPQSSSAANLKKSPNPSLKPHSQKDPVLFIKPETSVNKMPQSKTVPVSFINSATGLQLVRNNSPSLSQLQPNVINMKTDNSNSTSQKNVNQASLNIKNVNQASLNVKNVNQASLNIKNVNSSVANKDNQSAGKGQLKVTSQGLIHIERQTSRNIVNKPDQAGGTITVNGDVSKGKQQVNSKQPVVVVPNNNKLTLVSGKGKSLLNHPVLQNIPVTQSNGNVILYNQSKSALANGNAACLTQSSISANQNKGVSGRTGTPALVKGNANQSDNMLILQSKQSNRSMGNTPNHLVIIPVTSEQNFTMTTSSQSGNQATLIATSTSARLNYSNADKTNLEKKVGDKGTMFIVVQNDKTKGTTSNITNVKSEGQKSVLSLLGSRSVTSTNSSTTLTDICETKVSVSSSDNTTKSIIVVNKGEQVLESNRSYLENEKKLITDRKKKRIKQPVILQTVSPLRRDQIYTDMVSLVRASVLRHPVVSESAGQQLHPYCSRSTEEWLSWNVGKRRASEWQRASSIRKYIQSHLDGKTVYKGESLWTTKQIMTWCRLHAYSPHYLERPLHPTAIDLQAETSLPSEKHHLKFTSLSSSDQLVQEVMSLQQSMTSSDGNSDDEIDIVSVGEKKIKMKPEIKEEGLSEEIEYLPLTEGAVFVEETAKKIGVKLETTDVVPGYHGTVTHGIIYKAMEAFMGDLLRETFSLQVNMGRYPDALGVADVYSALTNLPVTDFLTNKYLGEEETKNIPNTNR